MLDLDSIPFIDVDDEDLTDAQLVEKYEVLRIGPAWMRNDDGSFRVPEFTLGWGVAHWCATWLNPLGDDDAVFRFTPEQFRLMLWWYAVDEDGNWLYESGVIQRIKGWGKDPFTAVLSLAEALGPVVFDGFDERGFPKGRPRSYATIGVFALSKGQTTNTSSMYPILISDRMKRQFGMEVGVEIIRANGGKVRIESKTSSFRSAEGSRTDMAILNETQHWLESNSGKPLSRTIRKNVGKVSGRYICITNAPKPGEDSVAEGDRDGYIGVLEGRLEDRQVLYDSVEAPDHAPLTERVFRLVYEQCRGDSVWCKWRNAWRDVLDVNNPLTESRRMYYNQFWTAEGSLFTPDEWAKVGTGSTLRLGDRICLGFDGGRTDDSTALVAIRLRDGLMVPLLLEERPLGEASDGWSANVDRVDSAVHRAFRDYNVVAFWADVQFWETQIQAWGEAYGSRLVVSGSSGPVAWDMRQSRRKVASLHEAFMAAILDGAVFHGVDPYGLSLDVAFKRHVMNAVRVDTSAGVTFGKRGGRESSRKVDMYAAAMLAFGAYQEVRLQQAMKPDRVVSSLMVHHR